jgi:uncharacterized protein (TIGR02453 family)
MPVQYFNSATFKFLRGLARNNSREWFNAHRDEYATHVRDPFLHLIADIGPALTAISPHFVADPRPNGGSLFRIHRDTRFSKDKTPYKTWAAARFFHTRHRELEGGTPVFYLHIEPGECFIGGGLWHGTPEAVRRVRDYMLNNPASWKKATRSAAFRRHFDMSGESLSRPPRGYDPGHELIEDLKRKDFVCHAAIDDAVVTSPALVKTMQQQLQRAAPLVDWLCGALDLDF